MTSRYTHGHEPSVLAAHALRTAENSAAYLLPLLKKGLSILDVGSGPGTITLDLARYVAPGVVVGVDASPVAVEESRTRATDQSDPLTTFQTADVMELPFPANSFDIVHAHQVLQHLQDPVGALREMGRVCKPGGVIAARDADYGAMVWEPNDPGIEEWLRVYSCMARANGAQPNAGRHMREWFERAGLKTESVSASMWCYADPESCRLRADSQAARIRSEAFREQAFALGVTESHLEAMVEGWLHWAEEPGATYLIPHVEVLARA